MKKMAQNIGKRLTGNILIREPEGAGSVPCNFLPVLYVCLKISIIGPFMRFCV
jgi:hypothetical protein